MSLRRLFPTLSLSLLLSLGAACGDDGGSGDGANPPADAGPDAGGDSDGGTDPGAAVEVCDTELAAPASGACDVATGTGGAVMILGDVLASEVVYENGAVVYEGDTIVCVGCGCADDAAYADATRVTCPKAAVSPGLINAHDHITFSEGTPVDHGDTRYDHRHDWRGSLTTPSNSHGNNGHRWGELRMLLSGVTSINGSGTVDGGVRNLDRLQNHERDRGFAEANYETFPLGDGNEQFRADCGWSFKFDEQEIADEPSFTPHVAEGVDFYATEEFRCQSSSFDGARDYTERNTAHVHAIGLTTADYFNMARDGAQIIWSARTNIDLYGFTAAVQIFHRLGGTVALGTDWSYSGSANMLRELACVDAYNRNQLDGYFSDFELWQLATRNAAIALGNEELLGSLEVGKVADLAIFAPDGPRYHRAVLESGNQDVELVVQSGVPMFGAQALVSGLGESCEPLDVCGQERAVCAEREYGESFAAIAADVSTGRPAYAAIFCGIPEGEPSCVPARPGEFTGVASADDRDGDGIADAADNCPAVFNPPRPIDDGAQPDDDGDGTGDACDDTPLAIDLDGDTVENDADNCPFTANSDQADADEDDKGDACDPCPETANPLSVCPPAPAIEATIVEVQNGTVATGTRVLVKDVVVTAVWSSGFWAQDPNAATAAHSGVHVFTGSDPGRSIGDLVDVEAEVAEYFEDTQLTADVVTAKGSATPIAPTAVTVADAATEPFEGVLVTITDATVSNLDHDCSTDNAACSDTGLWELDDLVLVYGRAYDAADWDDHKGQLPVTGVMGYRFDRRRIHPRTAADFGAN